ncbi:DUF4167 domain-containing protein [Faunimonas sp. B44]|uniref:DUF4167 domain-containing protein n=1 Tax=Faunimonas sp. B44 TaxID=3461493 RepID=UPI004043C769
MIRKWDQDGGVSALRDENGFMRHNQNRRSRGRNRKGPNPLTRSYESNGPDVKVRGTAMHVAEKYMTLARDALSSGDTVAAENYFQHAEHYNRIVMAAQSQVQPAQPYPARDYGDRDYDDDEDDEMMVNGRQFQRPEYDQPYEQRQPMQGEPRRGGQDEQRRPPREAQENQADDGDERPVERDSHRRRRPRYEDQPAELRTASDGDDASSEQPVQSAPAPAPAELDEAPKPRRRRTRKPAAAEAEADDGGTRDGEAALAAFPDR